MQGSLRAPGRRPLFCPLVAAALCASASAQLPSIFPPGPNYQPSFDICSDTIAVFEDSKYVSYPDFIQNIDVSGGTFGGLESLWLYPDNQQKWTLDLQIIDQIPPYPTELFEVQPKLTPSSGSCTANCGNGGPYKSPPLDTSVCSAPACVTTLAQCTGQPLPSITCVHMAVCVPPAVGLCTCVCTCQKQPDCNQDSSQLDFTLKPDVSGVVTFEITMTDNGGGSTDSFKRQFTLYIQDTNDGQPKFNLSENGNRRLEVYEDSCNIYSGFVRQHNVGRAYEEWAGEHLDYQFFPAGTSRHPNSIFAATYNSPSDPGNYYGLPGGECGGVARPCGPAPGIQVPAGTGNGHTGIDASFPEGSLYFCLARDVVDTVSVTMTCIDICFTGQEMHITTSPPGGVPPDGPQDPGAGNPMHDGRRNWDCWGEGPYADGNLADSFPPDGYTCQRTTPTGSSLEAPCPGCDPKSGPVQAGLGNQHSKCPEKYFEVSIIPVNDPPGRCPTCAGDRNSITVDECSEASAGTAGGCRHTVQLYEVGSICGGCCGPGGGVDEQGQRVDVNVLSKQPGIYEEYPKFCQPGVNPPAWAGCTPGSLTFKLLTWAQPFGNHDEIVLEINDDGGVDNRKCEQAGLGTSTAGYFGPGEAGGHCPFGQDKTYCSIDLVIREVNEPPVWEIETWNKRLKIEEDSGELFIRGFATHVNPGIDPGEGDQFISFNCSTSPSSMLDGDLKLTVPGGDLELVPALNANGEVNVTCDLCDRPPPGPPKCTPGTFVLDIAPINDCPNMSLVSPSVSAKEGSSFNGPVAIPYAGAHNEVGQTFTYEVWVHARDANYELFSKQPTIDPSGNVSFSCLEGRHGSTTVRVTVKDNGGGDPPHCDTGEAVDLTVVCLPHNQPPSFQIPDPEVVAWVDEGPVAESRFATEIDKGHPLEGEQNLTFFTTGYNATLFSSPPEIDPVTGTLTFTSAPGVTGFTDVVVWLEDDGGGPPGPDRNRSIPLRFNISIRGESAPTCQPGSTIYVAEDSGAYDSLWAVRCEQNGLLPYTTAATGCNTGVAFASGPTFTKDAVGGGKVAFSTSPDANGVTGTSCQACVEKNAALRTCYPLKIVVRPVNDPPDFALTSTVLELQEDAPETTFFDLIVNATVGPADEVAEGQWLLWSGRLQDETLGLLATPPEIVNGRHVRLRLAPDRSGTAVLLINATDASTVSKSESTVHSIVVKVTAVNDAPSFTPGDNVTADADGGELAVRWATRVTAGAPDEDASQTVAFTLTPASPSAGDIFTQPPRIAADGTLTVQPKPGVTGVSEWLVVLSDSGSPPLKTPEHRLRITTLKREPYRSVAWATMPDAVTVTEDGPPAKFPRWCAVTSPPLPWTVSAAVTVPTEADRFSVAPQLVFGAREPGPNGTEVQYGELTFETGPNRFGDPRVEVVVQDSYGTRLLPHGVLVRILPVNDRPSFVATETLRILSVPLASIAQWRKVPGFATYISAGPYEDTTQRTEFVTATNDLGCFDGVASVDGSGTLVLPFKDPPVVCTATLSVVLEDSALAGGGDRLRSASVLVRVAVLSSAPEMVTTQVPLTLLAFATREAADDVAAAAANATAARVTATNAPAADRAAAEAAAAAAEAALLAVASQTSLHASSTKSAATAAAAELVSLRKQIDAAADAAARAPLQALLATAVARNKTLAEASAGADAALATASTTASAASPVARENAFVQEFRANVSTAAGVPADAVHVESTQTTADGTTVRWSIAPVAGVNGSDIAPATDKFFDTKGTAVDGRYVNSTRGDTPAPAQITLPPTQPPTPASSGGGISQGMLIGIMAAVCLATLAFVAGAVYVSRQQSARAARRRSPSDIESSQRLRSAQPSQRSVATVGDTQQEPSVTFSDAGGSGMPPTPPPPPAH
eukprot:TRINITY_DN16500_c0_g1_i1.p1 TRINITY_DN16500_c0_g1~~TRINITY_DN16500_c0_g1_i1.p1  ORF type:complete len:1908 (+),score=472.40 TRINITY_DN16500_c0_g1_i1:44-5725(+)